MNKAGASAKSFIHLSSFCHTGFFDSYFDLRTDRDWGIPGQFFRYETDKTIFIHWTNNIIF